MVNIALIIVIFCKWIIGTGITITDQITIFIFRIIIAITFTLITIVVIFILVKYPRLKSQASDGKK